MRSEITEQSLLALYKVLIIYFNVLEDTTEGRSRVDVLNDTFDPDEWTYPRKRPKGKYNNIVFHTKANPTVVSKSHRRMLSSFFLQFFVNFGIFQAFLKTLFRILIIFFLKWYTGTVILKLPTNEQHFLNISGLYVNTYEKI